MKITGAEAVIKVLLEHGVDTVFGYPGGTAIISVSYTHLTLPTNREV